MKRSLALAFLLLIIALIMPKWAAQRCEGEALPAVKQEAQATVAVSAGDFRKSILRIYPDLVLEGDPSLWLGQVKRGESVSVGGREISAAAVSQIFLLESRDFELCWTGKSFLFEINVVDKFCKQG